MLRYLHKTIQFLATRFLRCTTFAPSYIHSLLTPLLSFLIQALTNKTHYSTQLSRENKPEATHNAFAMDSEQIQIALIDAYFSCLSVNIENIFSFSQKCLFHHLENC